MAVSTLHSVSRPLVLSDFVRNPRNSLGFSLTRLAVLSPSLRGGLGGPWPPPWRKFLYGGLTKRGDFTRLAVLSVSEIRLWVEDETGDI